MQGEVTHNTLITEGQRSEITKFELTRTRYVILPRPINAGRKSGNLKVTDSMRTGEDEVRPWMRNNKAQNAHVSSRGCADLHSLSHPV